MTVAEYQQEAQVLIQTLHNTQEHLPLIVGGTGLYISAVVDGLQIPPVAPQPALRSQLSRLGQTTCYALLQQVDPISAQRIHANDVVRTLRALEVTYVTGKPLSVQQGQTPPDYPILYLGLDCDPDLLAQRITQRTGQMLEQGLIQEVEQLCNRYGSDLPLLRTLGYAEILRYLAGDYSLAAAEALIVQHTRQFAKRQRTWFRQRSIQWFDATSPTLLEEIAAVVSSHIKFM
jgi:tRNA dimethylallyltransferase